MVKCLPVSALHYKFPENKQLNPKNSKHMKTFQYSIALTVSALLLTLYSCNYEADSFILQKSVFIEDVESPGLPIYSEWGYNTFGAYIDRQPFTSGNTDIPAKIIVNSDTMNIMLKGVMGNQFASITFSFIGYPIADFPDLHVLNDSILNMKGVGCIVTLTRGTKQEVLRIIEGKMHIKRVQKLYVDKQFAKSIVSGTFNFKTFFDKEPVAISAGRFDLGIGYESFYNF